MTALNVAVLVAAHNRASITVRGLASLTSQLDRASCVEYRIFLIDDGSTDGTSATISQQFPAVTIGHGTGSLYWSGGMAAAFRLSLIDSDKFDAYLLFNDDVTLTQPLNDFFSAYREQGGAVLVGAMTSGIISQVSYGAFNRHSRLRPLKFVRAESQGRLTAADTFNGNFVLIPGDLFRGLGGVDARLGHGYGDLDLGLRARAIGTRIRLYSPPVGVCEPGATLRDRIRSSNVRQRFALTFKHPFGVRPYMRFVTRHGVWWLVPAYYTVTVLKRCWMIINLKK